MMARGTGGGPSVLQGLSLARRATGRTLLPVSVFLAESSNTQPPSHWAVIALGVLTILYVAVIRPMRKGRRKDPLEKMSESPRHSATLAQQRAVEREMGAVLVEYEEMIRRMTAQLDTRATKLQLLIDEADARLLQLKEASGGHIGAIPRETAQAGDALKSSAPGGAKEAAAGLPGNGEDAAGAESFGGAYADVYDLADRGQSPRQIAQELNRPDGEIELILALRHSRSR
jgi:hypothetical protein